MKSVLSVKACSLVKYSLISALVHMQKKSFASRVVLHHSVVNSLIALTNGMLVPFFISSVNLFGWALLTLDG